MRIDEFITQSEGYYCSRYNPYQLEVVRQWLSKKSEVQIGFIYAEVLKILSPVYKTPPGIKELEDAFRKVKKERWDEIYPQVLPEYPDPDVKANQETVKKLFDGLKERLFIKALSD